MVIAGRSVHLTTLFSWASLNKQLTSNRAHTFACNWQQPFMNDSAEGRRMTVEIISWSISTKVWDRAGIELATPGSAVSFASVTRHITEWQTLQILVWCRCGQIFTLHFPVVWQKNEILHLFVPLLFFFNFNMFYCIKYLTIYKVHMYAGALRKLLYDCSYKREIIHSLKFVYYLPVHTHTLQVRVWLQIQGSQVWSGPVPYFHRDGSTAILLHFADSRRVAKVRARSTG